jgi:hypothetical protein
MAFVLLMACRGAMAEWDLSITDIHVVTSQDPVWVGGGVEIMGWVDSPPPDVPDGYVEEHEAGDDQYYVVWDYQWNWDGGNAVPIDDAGDGEHWRFSVSWSAPGEKSVTLNVTGKLHEVIGQPDPESAENNDIVKDTASAAYGTDPTDPPLLTVFEVVSLTIDSEMPSDQQNIPLNASGGSGAYTNKQAIVSIDTMPDNTPVDLDLGETTVASFSGSETATIIEGSPLTLTGNAKGSFEISYADKSASGKVFEFTAVESTTSYSPATTGDATISSNDDISFDSGNNYGTKHAGDVETKKYLHFSTDPAGCYDSYLKAKITGTQSFDSEHQDPTYGIYVFRDALQAGDLSISLSFGIVSVSQADTDEEGGWASWRGQVRIKGPTDTEWRETPTAQRNVKSSNISWMSGGWDFTDISTTSEVTTHVNHFKVGDSSSRVEARSRHSSSGAAANSGFRSKAETSLTEVTGARPLLQIDSSYALTPTSDSSP